MEQEKKFDFSEAIDILKERLENSMQKPETTEGWVELLKHLDPYEFIEIAQVVADLHLLDNYTTVQELAESGVNTTEKQLLMISMTKNF